MIKLRKLTEPEVTFTVSIEPEDMSVRGAFDSGDPDYAAEDRATEDAVIERLNAGDESAWCIVIVTAHWNGCYARETLGGCSLSESYTKETVASEHGMQSEALERLNRMIEARYGHMSDLLSVEQPADTRSMRDLANEAIRVQDACNMSGIVLSFGRSIARLRVLLREMDRESTYEINDHPIVKAWASKIHDLAGAPNNHGGSLSRNHWDDLHDLATRD